MITKIFAKGFKAHDFEQPLEQLNIIVGPNGSGKSARSDTLTLVINGYIPGSGKQNAEILDNFGTGDYLKVGMTISDKTFCREFKRSSKGTVSQTYYFSGHKVSKEDFIAYFERLGRPKILDLSAFLDQSDQKKIDTIFSLFPPDDDLAELEQQIEEKKTLINGYTMDMRTTEKTIQRLSRDKATIELPAGTLAEISGEIKKVDQEIETAKKHLEDVRIKEASDKAAERAKNEVIEKVKQDAIKKSQEEDFELSPIIDPPSFPGTPTRLVPRYDFPQITPKDTPETPPDAPETISKELPLSRWSSPIVLLRKFIYVLENLEPQPEKGLKWAQKELEKIEERRAA